MMCFPSNFQVRFVFDILHCRSFISATLGPKSICLKHRKNKAHAIEPYLWVQYLTKCAMTGMRGRSTHTEISQSGKRAFGVPREICLLDAENEKKILFSLRILFLLLCNDDYRRPSLIKEENNHDGLIDLGRLRRPTSVVPACIT